MIQTVRIVQRPPRYGHATFRRFCTVALGGILVFAVVCFFIPIALVPSNHGRVSDYMSWSKALPNPSWPRTNGISKDDLTSILLSTPDENKARAWSKYYASGPHLAGKNLSQALWTKDRWQEWGVKSDIIAYDVYINYPLDHRLALMNKHGDTFKVKYECSLEEDVLDEDPTTGLQDRIPTFHGYSASGNVTARYVFANFGTYQDFEDLLDAGVSLKGNIALVKYGRIFRGLKVKRAQELGMVGVVMYSDLDEDGEITEENGYKAYPDGPARNPSSVQRGSTQYISSSNMLPI